MQVIIEPPRLWEADKVSLDKDGLTVSPLAPKGSTQMPVAYVRCIGAEGKEVRAVLRVSGVTGELSVQKVRHSTDLMEFDLADAVPDAVIAPAEG